MHSIHSDGEWEPERLVKSARRAGLTAIALTDHDTVNGVAEAQTAGAAHDVEVITGVELSTWEDADVHLLAYGVDPNHEELVRALGRSQRDRQERALRMVQRLEELGAPVTYDRVLVEAGSGAVGRPHVARALVAAGHVSTVREAFDIFLADGKPACVEKQRLPTPDAIALVHRAGGVAVAAHPGTYGGPERLEPARLAGLDGVEVLHSLHGANLVRLFTEYADEHGMAKTGGTDFHGPRGGGLDVGSVRVPYEWVEDLKQRIEARRSAGRVTDGG
jgi:predicted metal-dependent phosphoesterase TrpH